MPIDLRTRLRYDDLLARIKIRTSADNLLQFIFTAIDHADAKLVGIRMRLDLFDHTDNDIVELIRRIDDRLDLDRTHREIISQLLIRDILRNINISFHPVQ